MKRKCKPFDRGHLNAPCSPRSAATSPASVCSWSHLPSGAASSRGRSPPPVRPPGSADPRAPPPAPSPSPPAAWWFGRDDWENGAVALSENKTPGCLTCAASSPLSWFSGSWQWAPLFFLTGETSGGWNWEIIKMLFCTTSLRDEINSGIHYLLILCFSLPSGLPTHVFVSVARWPAASAPGWPVDGEEVKVYPLGCQKKNGDCEKYVELRWSKRIMWFVGRVV